MNVSEGKGRPARKAGKFTAICEPIIYKIWQPRRLTALWASTVCYRGTFTFTFHALDFNNQSQHYSSVQRVNVCISSLRFSYYAHRYTFSTREENVTCDQEIHGFRYSWLKLSMTASDQ
jgi:hypothetical protein